MLCTIATFADGEASDWLIKVGHAYTKIRNSSRTNLTRVEMIALINSFDFKEQQAISFADIPDASHIIRKSKAFTSYVRNRQ